MADRVGYKHYLNDSVERFINSCHAPDSGKFCSDGSALTTVGVDLRNLTAHHGAEQKALQRVVEIIGRVHGVPAGYPDARVEIWSDLKGAQGSYDPGSRTVKLAELGEYPGSTLAHELGHHFTLAVDRDTKTGFYQKIMADPALKEWHQAVKATPQFLVFHNLEGATSGATQDAKEYSSYLKDPRELWARSYSQYIALKSQDPTLLAEHEKLREKASGNYQWTDEQFKPIAAAMDKYFESKGWLRNATV